MDKIHGVSAWSIFVRQPANNLIFRDVPRDVRCEGIIGGHVDSFGQRLPWILWAVMVMPFWTGGFLRHCPSMPIGGSFSIVTAQHTRIFDFNEYAVRIPLFLRSLGEAKAEKELF